MMASDTHIAKALVRYISNTDDDSNSGAIIEFIKEYRLENRISRILNIAQKIVSFQPQNEVCICSISRAEHQSNFDTEFLTRLVGNCPNSIKYSIRRDLIGGCIVDYQNVRHDYSASLQIERLRDHILMCLNESICEVEYK